MDRRTTQNLSRAPGSFWPLASKPPGTLVWTSAPRGCWTLEKRKRASSILFFAAGPLHFGQWTGFWGLNMAVEPSIVGVEEARNIFWRRAEYLLQVWHDQTQAVVVSACLGQRSKLGRRGPTSNWAKLQTTASCKLHPIWCWPYFATGAAHGLLLALVLMVQLWCRGWKGVAAGSARSSEGSCSHSSSNTTEEYQM